MLGESRAAELLESLAGRGLAERSEPTSAVRRFLRSRSPRRSGEVPPGPLSAGEDRVTRTRSSTIWSHGVVGFLPVLGLIALILAVIGWRFLAAPEPIEDRMGVVSAGDVDQADAMIDWAGAVTGDASGSNGSPHEDLNGYRTGFPMDELADRITTRLIIVHVAGAVNAPGVVTIPGGSRVTDAIAAAGGIRDDADPDRLNLAAELDDGWRIMVPIRGQELSTEVVLPDGVARAASTATGTGASGPGGGIDGPLNVNTASEEELRALPGVGPATAAAIVAKRDADGPFRSVDSLIEVRGIGVVKLEGLRDLVTIG